MKFLYERIVPAASRGLEQKEEHVEDGAVLDRRMAITTYHLTVCSPI